MNEIDKKLEMLYGAKANNAELYNFEVGNKLYIVDTKRNNAPRAGTIGQITAVSQKDEQKIYTVLWDTSSGKIEADLDPDDLVDLYVDSEVDIEIDKKFLKPFACPNCTKIIQEVFVEIITLTRDLTIHHDCMRYSAFKNDEMKLFNEYGGRENVKYYFVRVMCPHCRDEIDD